MKLIGTELGRLTVLFSAEEIRPLQGLQPLAVINAVKDRYNFQYSPDLNQPWDAIQKDGFIFKLGKFLREGKDVSIVELGIYNDGIVVNAYTTEDAEEFFNDLLTWVKKTFGYRAFTVEPRRIYASQITVQFGESVNHLIGKIDEITHLFTNLVNRTYNMKVAYEVLNVGFDYDRLITPPLYDLARFLIERRMKTKYEEGIFWCQAPLPTAAHIESLDVFEKLIAPARATKK